MREEATRAPVARGESPSAARRSERPSPPARARTRAPDEAAGRSGRAHAACDPRPLP
jgi:hypothetical protein